MKGICLFGAHHAGYPRSTVILQGLERLGIPVVRCVADPRAKVLRRYSALLGRWRRVGREFDAMFVPEFRHKDVPLAYALARRAGVAFVFDPLVSRFDTRVHDRGDVAPHGLQAWHNRNLDRVAFSLPDVVLADTGAHAEWYARVLAPPDARIRVLEVGYDDGAFQPAPAARGETATVLFYGSYLPLHGVETVVRAAEILRHDGHIRFELIGGGQTFAGVERFVRERELTRVTLRARVPAADLPSRIASASVCLGIFGTTPKAARVVPNKVYQCMAMERAVITMASPAVAATFETEREIVTVPAGDADALALAIRALVDDRERCGRVARAGAVRVARDYSPEPLARRFAAYCQEAVAR
jgi:glycosyltransferase involved in cell wall biosynthesis